MATQMDNMQQDTTVYNSDDQTFLSNVSLRWSGAILQPTAWS